MEFRWTQAEIRAIAAAVIPEIAQGKPLIPAVREAQARLLPPERRHAKINAVNSVKRAIMVMRGEAPNGKVKLSTLVDKVNAANTALQAANGHKAKVSPKTLVVNVKPDVSRLLTTLASVLETSVEDLAGRLLQDQLTTKLRALVPTEPA